MKKGIRYIPPLVIALSLTIAGNLFNIPATFIYGGIVASVLIVVLGVKDLTK